MGAEPQNKNNLQFVFNVNDKPVVITFDIEHDSFRTYYTSISVFRFQFICVVPGRVSYFIDPGF